ncbi:hypothetical protein OTU49_009060 [Cherax quadricarinatus]|uniref:Uncharacterized protein n=1 Tax=Cherax quadricarinatus TaxID=27406 RepID=A0AAW0WCC7_CHEQU|nr:uncharacterized protein LOC128700264 [Cherax quadricarinatus]
MKLLTYLILTATLLVLLVGAAPPPDNNPFDICLNETLKQTLRNKLCTSVEIPEEDCESKTEEIQQCNRRLYNGSDNEATKNTIEALAECMTSIASINITPADQADLKTYMTFLSQIIPANKDTVCSKIEALADCFKTKSNMYQHIKDCLDQNE